MNAFITVAGWTLLHFVWEGAAIALAAFVMLWLLRHASPHSRYAAACGALAAMLVAPVITARVLSTPAPVAISSAASPSVASTGTTWSLPHATSAAQEPYGLSLRVGVRTLLPVFVGLWVAGVTFLLVRLVGGWWRVRSRHRTALAMAASRWQNAGERMALRLGLRRRVLLVDTSFVDTPTVIGWVRPIVLLPIAALAGLTPAQVEAILAHELAHVRRHDYLINLLQSVAETLLFYHPAVWWVSARIRVEREHCCDEVAVNVCGDAVGYAAALAELETWRTASTTLVLAATGGSLLERIRRVLRVPVDNDGPSSNAILTGLLIVLIVVAGGSRYLPAVTASTATPGGLTQATPRTNWQTYETPHFDVLYTQRLGIDLDSIERDAERAYEQVGSSLTHDLSYRPYLVLFNTRRELEGGLSARDFPQGRDHILLSLELPASRLGGELVHEIAHSFFFDILPSSVSATLPLWISEGLAEYQRGTWDETEQATLSGLVRTNAIPRMSLLTPYSFSENPRVNYALGHAAFEFIESRWSKDGIRRLLLSLRQTGATGGLDSVLAGAFGLGPNDFDRDFEAYLKTRFAGPEIIRIQRVVEDLRLRAQQARQLVYQAAAPSSPAFEVASVKPNRAGDEATIIRNLPDQFIATNITLRLLIRLAFQLQDNQISGGPSWLNSDRFDVAAKAEGNSPPDQRAAMMRALLLDRFKLRTHNETGDLPIYALVVARSGGRLGARLRLTDCGRESTRPGLPNADQLQPCGSVRTGPDRVTARGTPMSQVISVLSPLLGRVVVDRTGLDGSFDFDLEWTPDQVLQGTTRDPNGLPVAPADTNGPSVFAAIQEQLGLKLEAQRAPIDVLVIDRVEQPSEN